MKQKSKKIDKLFTVPIGPYTEKYFSSVLEASLDLRSRAASKTSGKYFSVRTSKTVNNLFYYVAMKNPAFWLVDVRSVKKFPYSDRLFELSELATILTCFDKKTSTILFKYSLKKKKKSTDKGHKIPKRYRRDFKLKFCGIKSKT